MDGSDAVSPLFLRRSFPAPRPARNSQPPEEALADALRGVVVLNRLECKVACASCKVRDRQVLVAGLQVAGCGGREGASVMGLGRGGRGAGVAVGVGA